MISVTVSNFSSYKKGLKVLIWKTFHCRRTITLTSVTQVFIFGQFLDYTRPKFVGFTLEGDRTTLAGLPQPIHEGVRILSKHM